MNKDFIVFNLNEAKKSIEQIIKEFETNNEYYADDSMYWVDMQHLYWHINSAWNARNSSSKESDEGSEENFEKWNKFPSDLEL
jgi:hypothetical protein